jgi:RNA polymerase sigma factor (sigma-70 family)
MQDDFELLRQFANGASEEAFAALVRRHIGAVYSVALRRVGGDAHLADDVTQEVFGDLARKAASFGHRDSLLGWLFIATRFAAAKAVRRDKTRRNLIGKAQQMIEQEGVSSGEPDWDAIRPVLDELIQRLGDKDRDAILLHFFEKRTFGDLGTLLSLSESGARMRVERALARLRVALGRRGITSTTAALSVALADQVVAAVPSGLAATVTTSALASANSGGAAVLLLMSITKTQLATAMAVVLAGASVMGVIQNREITTLRAEKTSAELDSAANAKRVSELAGKLSIDDAALEAMRAQASASKAGPGSAGGGTATSGQGVKVVHLKDILREHPEYEALQKKEFRRSVVREYSRAIASLNLPTDKAAQLKELLIERELTSFDAENAATQAGFAQGSKEEGKAVSDATKDSNQAITALIGSDASEKLEALKGTEFFGSQTGVDDFAVDMADAGVSMSTDQTQALAQSLHVLSNPAKNPNAASPDYAKVDPSTWQSPLDLQLFANAEAFLTPAQLQVLKTSRAENNEREAILKQYTGNEAAMIMQ